MATNPYRRRVLTLDDLYHPERKLNFEGKSAHSWVWQNPERYVRTPLQAGRKAPDPIPVPIAGTPHRERPVLDPLAVRRAVDIAARGSAGGRPLSMVGYDPAIAHVLVADDAVLYRYDVAEETALRLTERFDTDVGAGFSPDGRWIGWIRDNDIHVAETDTGRARPLTLLGSEESLVGRLDWVYQEEIYGRGTFRGYWWSPEAARIAFLQLDVSRVARHTLAGGRDPETYRYPRPGTPNPSAHLGIAELASGRVTWADLSRYDTGDILVVGVEWSPDGGVLSCRVQDREQTWLDLNFVDPRNGSSWLVVRETSAAWVPNPGAPTWLDDGSFLWISDRTGHSHVYLYHAAGSLKGPVTAGEWDVRKVHGVEAAGSWMYFSATERSPISVHTYRIRTDGRDMERLTSAEGTHESTFSPGMGYFIDTWSASGRPAEVRLHSSDGSEIRVLEESTAPAVPDFELGSTEYFQVDARDGFRLEAMMIKPPDFDPNRRYPVLCHVYGGPMTPLVRNAWGGPTFLWHHLIASRGAIVWVVDNRTASAKGVGSAWPAYRCFGTTELRDLEDAVGWLRGQRYIDPDRFGIWGWSFGGYLTAYAMTHSRLFRMGIAGAPVTDWTLYDTVYTERYMQTPERNPEGYRSSSVLEAASRLHGKLLILHGTLDDNVHVEHSMRLVRELQRSGKDFHLMLYPGAGHVIEDADQLYDVRKRMTSFVLENL